MKILAADIGTGTQDVIFFDTAGPIENAPKLVMPSATSINAGRIRRATAAKQPVVLTGVIQGGGPCHWALEDHLRAGLAAFATPEAATTFDDDLEAVAAMGVTLVSEDEAARTEGEQVVLRDLDLDAIRSALHAFDVDPAFDGFAVGCLDHGASPPGYSDRLFRFDHLRRVVEAENDLRAFAYLPQEVPEYLTRAAAVLRCIDVDAPTVFLDTGPAAALGALQDPAVGKEDEALVLNLGNMHALAFHLRGTRIVSLYEHHTGEMSDGMIENFTQRLLSGSLRHEEVFDSKGHGVFYAHDGAQDHAESPLIAVTGPQRARIRQTRLDTYFAAPHGDMMLSGAFGMLRAFAHRHPEHAEEINSVLLPA
jgi:uncharacterized protein (DUF1786 family)